MVDEAALLDSSCGGQEWIYTRKMRNTQFGPLVLLLAQEWARGPSPGGIHFAEALVKGTAIATGAVVCVGGVQTSVARISCHLIPTVWE